MKKNRYKIIAAPNAFKECLSASEAASAIARGAAKAGTGLEAVEIPLADGGDGMLPAMLAVREGKRVAVTAKDPLGREIETEYGVLSGGTAVVEMSLVSGLNLVAPGERNASTASTFGTGQIIAHAYEGGCRNFIIGIGGSATTDGGAGMAQALGWDLLDKNGNQISPGGAGLIDLASADESNSPPGMGDCRFAIACDVQNPLLGPKGAAAVYAPQKGASREEVPALERGLNHLADVMEKHSGKSLRDKPGTGAAGGIGFMFLAMGNAKLVPGAELILQEAGFREKCLDAHLIITGEGALDRQSANGKLPFIVAREGKRLGIPVIALAGSLKPGWESLKNSGLAAAFSIAPGPVTREYSMEHAAELLEAAATETMGVFLAGKEMA